MEVDRNILETIEGKGLSWYGHLKPMTENRTSWKMLNWTAEETRGRGSEIGRGVQQGCPLSSTLFNIYLENVVKNCFQNMGGVKVGGRKIKCIRFVDDMALLAEEKTIVRDMLLELNDNCECVIHVLVKEIASRRQSFPQQGAKVRPVLNVDPKMSGSGDRSMSCNAND
ncbi:hypothetical protein ANN_18309 [Periplaneta americana]|uniref:Reverse transcriptase domain-containing protein n=1 Tax=Periplaneta americana TaxID=6978 RepID=A0ABQ8SP12_PERAM|nr:hypothetical protein ANN_18309 [Periplaneta americana]